MHQECIGHRSVQFLQRLDSCQELKILLPDKLVLLILAAGTIIEVHNPSLDAIIVAEVVLHLALSQSFLPLVLDSIQLLLVLDCFQEVLDQGVFPLQLVLMVSSLFHDLLDLRTREEILLLVPEELIAHLLKDVLDLVCHFSDFISTRNTPFP